MWASGVLLYGALECATASWEIAVKGGLVNVKPAGDFGDGDFGVGEQGAGDIQAGHCPLVEDGPLELGQAGKNVEDKSAAAGSRIDVLGQRVESDFAVLWVLDGLEELLEGIGHATRMSSHYGGPGASAGCASERTQATEGNGRRPIFAPEIGRTSKMTTLWQNCWGIA